MNDVKKEGMLLLLYGSIIEDFHLIGAAFRNSQSVLDEKTIIESLSYCRQFDDKKSPSDFEKEILGSW